MDAEVNRPLARSARRLLRNASGRADRCSTDFKLSRTGNAGAAPGEW